jgi:glycosyltransferase involved in cell wall biosynthesis
VTARLWIDVEDLFEYARSSYRRPSGIQRLAFEVARELQARLGDAGLVRFVRHSFAGDEFLLVTWPEVAALFQRLSAPDDAATQPAARTAVTVRQATSGTMFMQMPARQFIRRLAYRLPPLLRVQLADALATQARAFRLWGLLLSALLRGVNRIPMWIRGHRRQQRQPSLIECPAKKRMPPVERFADLIAPGDMLLMLSAAWSHDYARLIERQCKAHGMGFGVLIYDLIPVRRPEWCNANMVGQFRNWICTVLPLCDKVFAISCATKLDVEAFVREQGMALPCPILTLPIGGTLQQIERRRTERLPPPGGYALIVSTIEARKNHLLLFRVWRRLLEELPPERVPTLVFAGRVGWLVADLMQQIANTDHLGGKLTIVEDPSDGELASLYDGCLFTLFPSFYEGWGLPVTESLGFGKPCIIANRTSLPEAGGDLVKNFDPDNLHDAYAVIRGVIEDREGLAAWEAQVRREFRPISWAATAEALLAGLDHPTTELTASGAVHATCHAPPVERIEPHLESGDPASSEAVAKVLWYIRSLARAM